MKFYNGELMDILNQDKMSDICYKQHDAFYIISQFQDLLQNDNCVNAFNIKDISNFNFEGESNNNKSYYVKTELKTSDKQSFKLGMKHFFNPNYVNYIKFEFSIENCDSSLLDTQIYDYFLPFDIENLNKKASDFVKNCIFVKSFSDDLCQRFFGSKTKLGIFFPKIDLSYIAAGDAVSTQKIKQRIEIDRIIIGPEKKRIEINIKEDYTISKFRVVVNGYEVCEEVY
jgi:hypothetical protein